jgi:hypothetical protein
MLDTPPPSGGLLAERHSSDSHSLPSSGLRAPSPGPATQALPRLRHLTLVPYGVGAAISGGTTAVALGVEAVAASPLMQTGVLGLGTAALIGVGAAAHRPRRTCASRPRP